MGKARILIGVGVGPGDPELVTLKAQRILRDADIILVPETEMRGSGPGRAEEIVAAVAPENTAAIRRVKFSMSTTLSDREATRDDAAVAAINAFNEGATTVAMATIGDPNVFSTFTYLADGVRAQLPDVRHELVSGITAMQAIAVAADVPLVIGDEVLALVPATAGLDKLDAALAAADTIVIYKGGRQMADVVAHARAAGKQVHIASNLSLPEQILYPDTEADDVARVGYFSTVLATNPVRQENQ